MADLLNYPLEDNYSSTLAQSWAGGTGAMYVNATPSFTFPSGVTTYVVVNPGKSNMQIAEINAYDASAGTLTVSNVTLNSGASTAYSAQTHAVGSTVRISDNFQFWEDLATAINSKVDTNDQIDFDYYATVAARDAAIPSPTIGKDFAFCLDTGLLYIYNGSGWEGLDTGTLTANASATVSGKVEIATTAELTAGTDTGGTGALLSALPSDIQASKQSGEATYAGASAVGTDAYAVTMTPTLGAYATGMSIQFLADVANTGACTIDVDSLGVKNIKSLDGNDPQDGAIRIGHNTLVYDGTNFVLQSEDIASATNQGIVELLTPAEVRTGTDTARAATAEGIAAVTGTAILQTTRASDAASGAVNVAHGLSYIPRRCSVHMNAVNGSSTAPDQTIVSAGFSDGAGGDACSWIGMTDGGASQDTASGNDGSNAIHFQCGTSSGDRTQTAVITFDGTNVILTWTKASANTDPAVTANITILAHL